jgi:Cytochrome P460
LIRSENSRACAGSSISVSVSKGLAWHLQKQNGSWSKCQDQKVLNEKKPMNTNKNEINDAGERPSKTKNKENRIMKKLTQLFAVLTAIPVSIAFCTLVSFIFAQTGSAQGQEMSMPDAETPKYTADGELIPFSADVYREWIWVGEPLTPNSLNPPEANFPEFHDVYINPTAWRVWKNTGTFPDGTVMIKELTTVGFTNAPSGDGYFQGEFTGLEHAIKDSKRFPKEAQGWGYFTFGHKYPLKKHAPLQQFSTCAQCHVANAKDNVMVFIEYYPVLRAARGK